MNLQLFFKFQNNKYVKILESKTRESDKYIPHLQNIFWNTHYGQYHVFVSKTSSNTSL